MPQYANRRHNRRQRRLTDGSRVVGGSLIAKALIVGTTMGAEPNSGDTAASPSVGTAPAEIDFWPPAQEQLPRVAVEPTTTPTSTPSTPPESSPTPNPPGDAPTSTPSSGPTTSPSNSPTSNPSAAPIDGYPDASNTGVPAGVELSKSGGLTITEDDTVIDAQEITGTVKVEADDVVIRRSKIISTGRYPIE